MDFFEAQAAAHSATSRLVGLFCLAVLALITLTVLLVAGVIAWTTPPTGYISVSKLTYAVSPGLALWIATGVIAFVLLASAFRLRSLSGGGRAVAESLGGRLLLSQSTDPDERRVLNVVEEMAIAAGLPVPPVYVLDEAGINAFAAGYGPDDAVVGVTRGCMETLSRDELQGVVGHEFSHLLNGDMRLNLRLAAVLFGILAIGVIGRSLVGRRGYGAAALGSSRGRGSSASQIAILALGLMAIGYVGTFFGNLIKAAVSRQREFLADASAVQFTRHPQGIANALRRIGGSATGSRVGHGRADELSHLFFGEATTPFLQSLHATHPPLDARIRAIDPRWDGSFLPPHRPDTDPLEDEVDAGIADDAATDVDALLILPAAVAGASTGAAMASEHLGRALGQVTPDDVSRARSLIGGLPQVFHDAAHDPFGARAAIYALVIPEDPAPALALIDARAEPGVPAALRQLLAHREALPEGGRMALVQIAMPALKALSAPQYQRFRANLIALIKLDDDVSRLEWILHLVVLKELRPHFEGVRRRASGARRIGDEEEACWVLLSALAQIDHKADEAEDACRAGLRILGIEFALTRKGGLASEIDPRQRRLTEAARRLRRIRPLDQPRLLKAAMATVEHDGRISAAEHELLAGVAAALDCPLPPFQQSTMTAA